MLLLLVILLIKDACSGQSDRAFDPLPSIPKYVSPKPDRPQKPSNLIIQNKPLFRELIGYKPGTYIHPAMPLYNEKIAAEIRMLERQGFKLRSIVIRGFADGLPNRGIHFNVAAIPEKCRSGVVGRATLKDPDLAFLRSCIVWDDLSRISGQPIGQPAWFRETYDIPDGGPIGPQHRKVVVELRTFQANNFYK